MTSKVLTVLCPCFFMVVDVNCAVVEARQKPGFCGVEIDAFDVTVVVLVYFLLQGSNHSSDMERSCKNKLTVQVLSWFVIEIVRLVNL